MIKKLLLAAITGALAYALPTYTMEERPSSKRKRDEAELHIPQELQETHRQLLQQMMQDIQQTNAPAQSTIQKTAPARKRQRSERIASASTQNKQIAPKTLIPIGQVIHSSVVGSTIKKKLPTVLLQAIEKAKFLRANNSNAQKINLVFSIHMPNQSIIDIDAGSALIDQLIIVDALKNSTLNKRDKFALLQRLDSFNVMRVLFDDQPDEGKPETPENYKFIGKYSIIKAVAQSNLEDKFGFIYSLLGGIPIHSAELFETYLLHEAIKYNDFPEVKRLIGEYGNAIIAKSGHGSSTLPVAELYADRWKNHEIYDFIKAHGGQSARWNQEKRCYILE